MGVTREAQNLFDALAKTCALLPALLLVSHNPPQPPSGTDFSAAGIHPVVSCTAHGLTLISANRRTLLCTLRSLPCRWKEKSILVLEEVLIQEPYKPETCSGGDATLLSRVQKVVRGSLAAVESAAVFCPTGQSVEAD